MWGGLLDDRKHLVARMREANAPKRSIHPRTGCVYVILRHNESETLVFEKFKEALDSVLDSASRPDDRDVLRNMRAAVIEAKTSLGLMTEAIEKTANRLQRERTQLADAERRGQLADGIRDFLLLMARGVA